MFMPDWWSAVNTLIGSVLLVFGWGIRREFGKIDKILQQQNELQQQMAAEKAKREAHDVLDNSRFADHERWLQRLDNRIGLSS